MNLTVIGITDQKQPEFNSDIANKIAGSRYFAGGKRHYELVKTLLPEKHEWLEVTVPLEDFYTNLKLQNNWIIFASGDPLFYGLANSLKKRFSNANIQVYSAFNSLQLLAQKQLLAYGEARIISLTGRPWEKLFPALIDEIKLIGILTDRKHTPVTISKLLLDYGYSNYRMHIGEFMGGDREKIASMSLEEAVQKEFAMPNCLYLEKISRRNISKNIPELEFKTLEGRPNMITKMPIRITTLALMELKYKTCFWDIGSCTGSISIDTRLQYPHLQIYAFEIRQEGKELMQINSKQFGAPGINFYAGDFMEQHTNGLPLPDAIFLGGYGGKMELVLEKADKHLKTGGVIAFNSVSEKSHQRFITWANNKNYNIKNTTSIKVDQHNPVDILIIEKA